MSQTGLDLTKVARAATALLILFSAAQAASAKTAISKNDCNATVSMKIAFYGRGVNRTQVNQWIGYASNLWNGSNGYQTFGDCRCKAFFDFTPMVVANRSSCPRGAHCINVLRLNPAAQHRSSIGWRVGSWDSEGFSSSPYNHDSPGEFSDRTTGDTAAHEIGHLMGVPDEYFEFRASFNMVDGKAVVTEFEVVYPAWHTSKSNDPEFRRKVEEKLNSDPNVLALPPRDDAYGARGPGAVPGSNGDSIMIHAPGRNWTAMPKQIEMIFAKRNISCPDKCCCGNGRIEANKSEECDKAMRPTTCKAPAGQTPKCEDNCKCKKFPQTGGQPPTDALPQSQSSTTTTTTSTTATTPGRVVNPTCGDGYLSWVGDPGANKASPEECDLADNSQYNNWAGAKKYNCPPGLTCKNCKCTGCGDGRLQSGEDCDSWTFKTLVNGQYAWQGATIKCEDGSPCVKCKCPSSSTTTTMPTDGGSPSDWGVKPTCGDGYISYWDSTIPGTEECDLADDSRYNNWSGATKYKCPGSLQCVNCKCTGCGDGRLQSGEECDTWASKSRVDGNYLWSGTDIPCGEGKICVNCKCIAQDSDKDGVPDGGDKCPGYDDGEDYDGDGTPDTCDTTPIDCSAHCTGSGWKMGAYVNQGQCQPPIALGGTCQYVCRYAQSFGWGWTTKECCCGHYYVGTCPPTDGGGCTCPSQTELQNTICPAHRPKTPPLAP